MSKLRPGQVWILLTNFCCCLTNEWIHVAQDIMVKHRPFLDKGTRLYHGQMLCILNMTNGKRYWRVLSDNSWVVVKLLLEPHNTPGLELSKSLEKRKGPKILMVIEKLPCAWHFANTIVLNSLIMILRGSFCHSTWLIQKTRPTFSGNLFQVPHG